MYIETDCEDGSSRCIRDVTVCVVNQPGIKETLRHPPYVMTSWRTDIRGRELDIECIVTYKVGTDNSFLY